MGYKILCASVVVVLTLVSCEKVGYYLNFNVDLPYSNSFSSPEFDTSIIINDGGVFYSLPSLAIVTNATATIHKVGLDTNKIVAIRLKSFCQRISNASPSNFDFVDSLQVYISAEGFPEVLLAQQNNIPDGTDSVLFDCTDQNLKNYLTKDTVFLRMQGHFYNVPPASAFRTDFKFGATASLLN